MHRYTIVLLGLVLSASSCGGDGWQHPWTKANPNVHLKYGPFDYNSFKDVDVKIDSIEAYDARSPSTKPIFLAHGVTIRSNATDVRHADVLQTQAMTDLTKEITAPIKQALDLGGKIVGLEQARIAASPRASIGREVVESLLPLASQPVRP